MSINQILLALIVPITWGFGYALTKIGMDQFAPLLLMSLRFGIAGLILVWFTKPPWGFMRELFIIAFIGSTIQYGFTYYGLKGIDVSTASILVQLEGPILALLSTHHTQRKTWLASSPRNGVSFYRCCRYRW